MPGTGWQIRKISDGEVDLFRQIRLDALKNEPNAFASRYEDWDGFPDAEWRKRMTVPIFVAFAEKQPVGLMALKQLQPPKMKHRAKLEMVYVNEGFRGTGLGGALLCKVVQFAEQQGIKQIELGVREDRAGTIRFYRRAGFMQIGKVPQGYIEDGVEFNEILMVKRLNVDADTLSATRLIY
ncbi:GNAT family N-acetyltransferase [Agrobacterium sp. SORGH_AS 787]|uniref:GNAT family N-acetyltransferase n=1 Tax=Agrobacterium sp. SORGH_AS 787 TaxID=3041775 RepID=UPI0027867E59|nr:ribosomal protein S18 acetylase RimI-like enzyme [Rhizobium sp. SORGH_AS_0787]